MSTTRAEAAYRRSAAAFRNPMLGLLHGRYAPFVVAVLSVVFTADRATVAVSDAHAEIAEVIDQLRGAGYDHDERRIPSGTAREICRYWVKVGWLVPQIEDDVEVYRLSAQAVGALEVAGRAGGGRTRVSQSRVRTLLESVDRLSVDADDDRDARIARLRADRDHSGVDTQQPRGIGGEQFECARHVDHAVAHQRQRHRQERFGTRHSGRGIDERQALVFRAAWVVAGGDDIHRSVGNCCDRRLAEDL